jgi:hypothetical protein
VLRLDARLAAAFARLGATRFELFDDVFHAGVRNRWTAIVAPFQAWAAGSRDMSSAAVDFGRAPAARPE